MGARIKASRAKRRDSYHQVREGEWIAVPRRGHKNACCDCSLVHRFDYRVRDGAIEMRVSVDRRATAARRRALKFAPEERFRPHRAWGS